MDIESTPNDVQFRRIVHETLRSAKKEIVVITGELGSYGYPELREDALDALARGITVRVFTSAMANPDFVSELSRAGAEVHTGGWIPDHALIVDNCTTVMSFKDKTGRSDPGTRHGRVTNDPVIVLEQRRRFDKLVFFSFIETQKNKSLLVRIADAILTTSIPRYAIDKRAISAAVS